jgi:hypothetical protein
MLRHFFYAERKMQNAQRSTLNAQREIQNATPGFYAFGVERSALSKQKATV